MTCRKGLKYWNRIRKIQLQLQHKEGNEEKKKHKLNNEKLAKSRIKLGLLLNEYGEKNNLKVSDAEVKSEIQKQIQNTIKNFKLPAQIKLSVDVDPINFN